MVEVSERPQVNLPRRRASWSLVVSRRRRDRASLVPEEARRRRAHPLKKKKQGRAPSAGKLGIYGSVATSVFTRRDALPPLEKSKVRAPRETTWILFLDYTPTLDLRGYIANKRIVLLLLLCFAIFFSFFSFFFFWCWFERWFMVCE